MHKSLLNKINSSGLSYTQYCELTKREIAAADTSKLNDSEQSQLANKKINLHRMTRIEKHSEIHLELKELLKQINKPQLWLVISETWCGDSAQNIPFISKMAKLNPNIELKIMLRDENPDVMDLYLTNGTRSIPILVALDENGNELFKWGPRPEEAKKLFSYLEAKGIRKQAILEKLHLWYGKNRGKNLEAEIKLALLSILIEENNDHLIK